MEPSTDQNPQPQPSEPKTPNEADASPAPAETPESSTPSESADTPSTPVVETIETVSSEDTTASHTEPVSPDVSAPNPSSESENSAPTASSLAGSKNKKALIALIFVLVVAILTGGGFLIWSMLPGSQEPPKQNQSSSSSQDQPSNNTNQTSYDMGALSDFDLTFLRLENTADNVVYSPLSIKYALAMLSDAAAGESKTQITNLIGDYQPTKYVNNEHRSFANAMFIRENVKDYILPSYTNNLEQKYSASVFFDPFTSAAPINSWISDKTMGIIQNIVSDDAIEDADFTLVNALAIDMNWNNQLQCAGAPSDAKVPCQFYLVNLTHENYHEMIDYVGDGYYDKINFNGSEVDSARIGTTANRYDIIKELGEDYIRSTVLTEYEKWKAEYGEEEDFNIDEYIKQLGNNYGKIYNSTDFFFSDNSDEKIFAKDLREYDGSTLQYIGIMPKNKTLSNYTNTLTVEKLSSLIGNLKDASDINSFKEGVVTKIEGHIPLFNFNYELKLKDDLEKLGVINVFDGNLSDLSNLTQIEHSYIYDALHKADIDFSNDGIRAAAATVLVGGLGSAVSFDYQWDVPVEEIDMTFDKPFFFLIRDKATGEVWFTGTVYNPAK